MRQTPEMTCQVAPAAIYLPRPSLHASTHKVLFNSTNRFHRSDPSGYALAVVGNVGEQASIASVRDIDTIPFIRGPAARQTRANGSPRQPASRAAGATRLP